MIRNKLIAESIISLTRAYNVEERLLGQTYRFELDDRFDMEIMLPLGAIKDKLGVMVAPNEYHGDADVEWGVFSPASKDWLSACHIESVYVRIWAFKGVDLSAIRVGFDNPLHLIQQTLTKLLMSVRVINPKCVRRINGRLFDGGDVERMIFSQLSLEGIMTKWNVGRNMMGEFYDALNKYQLMVAYKNLHNDVSVPYSIYESARSFLDVMDTRNCILALATMVEVVYKQKMDEYFEENNIPVEMREYLKKNTDGMPKYAQLFKKLGIEFHENNIKKKVMEIRNHVIHANYHPTGREAFDAYIEGDKFLRVYRIPMFIKNNSGQLFLGIDKDIQLGSFTKLNDLNCVNYS